MTVLLEPEDSITRGLRPGTSVDSVRDGWRVRFDKYLVSIGRVELSFATDAQVQVRDEDAYVVDLSTLPPSGEPLWRLDDLRAGRWSFAYELVGAADGAKRHSSVSAKDFERVQKDDLTYLIVGTLEKADGTSCPPPGGPTIDAVAVGENQAGHPCYANGLIEFEFAVRAEAKFSNCQIDGIPGVSVSRNGASTVAATLHGDHLFFNGFPSGSEGGIQRLAQIWADTDVDLDGHVSTEEFRDLLIADMGEWDARYQGGGSPLPGGVMTMGDLAEGQLKTQGHMDGEGECGTVDGHTHDHDHDHDTNDHQDLDAGRRGADAAREHAGPESGDSAWDAGVQDGGPSPASPRDGGDGPDAAD